jgi:hypothetical protein
MSPNLRNPNRRRLKSTISKRFHGSRSCLGSLGLRRRLNPKYLNPRRLNLRIRCRKRFKSRSLILENNPGTLYLRQHHHRRLPSRSLYLRNPILKSLNPTRLRPRSPGLINHDH